MLAFCQWISGIRYSTSAMNSSTNPAMHKTAGYQKIGTVQWVGENIKDRSVGETVFSTIGYMEGMHHDYAGQVSPSVCTRDDVWKLPRGIDPLAFAGMVLVPLGYGIPEFFDISEVNGGTPYGASTIAGGDGSRQPSEKELAIARFQGKHVAELAIKLHG